MGISSGFPTGSHARLKTTLAISSLIISGYGATSQPQPQSRNLESEVKAEFIERFAHYIEWPPVAFEADTTAFTVCVIGDGGMDTLLEKVLAKTKIKGRQSMLVLMREGESPAGCHILYIGSGERDQVENIVRQIGESPVLTIGDSLEAKDYLVHINLFLEGSHVRFTINAAAAKANGLNMSAKLLALARPAGESR